LTSAKVIQWILGSLGVEGVDWGVDLMRFGANLKTLTAVGCLAAASPAVAADLYEPAPEPTPEVLRHSLEWTIIPFNGWLPGMSGTIGAFNAKADVDMSPIDILSNISTFVDALDGLYIGSGQVNAGKFGLMYDVLYLSVGTTAEFGGGIICCSVDVGFSEFMGTLAGTYRFHESAQGHMDALVGARWYDISADVGVLDGISDGGSWVDPMIGVAGRHNFTDRWYVNGWGMIGGFGVGSDFTWDVWANVGYRWHDWLDVYAGFRATGADYASGSFTWNVTQYGPTVGAALNF
jgi:hypothetical protein